MKEISRAFLIACALAVVSIPHLALSAPADRATPRIAGAEKVQVELVLIDVIVRDRKDQPVRHLGRDDFELTIDGRRVDASEIESLEEICTEEPGSPAGPQAAGAEESSPPAPYSPAPANPALSRHVILYFDFAHLTMSGSRLALRSARRYLTRAPELGDAAGSETIMLLGFRNGLRLVQDFTTDRALLVSKIDAMLSDPATIDTDVMEEEKNALEVYGTPCGDPTCSMRKAAASARAINEEMRGRDSLRALTGLMPALRTLPGRKAVILFSDSLRTEPGAQYFVFTPETPSQNGISLETDMLRAASAANASNVSFYTVHAGGMTANDLGTDPVSESARAGNDSAFELQATMALDTGGRSLTRANDLGRILDTARRDLSCYYVLGYRYAGHGDDRRHSIMVRTTRGGLTVRHRPYYTDESPSRHRARLLESAASAPELFHGLPVTVEVFALAPVQSGQRVLIQCSVPASSLPLVPLATEGGDWMEGRVAFRGDIAGTGKAERECQFDFESPVRVARSALDATRIVYETGCVLSAGDHALSVMVMDPASDEIGARRKPFGLTKTPATAGAHISQIQLWSHEPRAQVFTSRMSVIGMEDLGGAGVLMPSASRRMEARFPAALGFAVCPRDRQPAGPLRVLRTLDRGDVAGAQPLSALEEVTLSGPPDAESGCYQVSTAIPAGTLQAGEYTFSVLVTGDSLKASPTRSLKFTVD